MAVLVRSRGEPGALVSRIREEVRAVDQDLPVFDVRTMPEQLALARWPFRVFGSLFAIFAVIALVLAAVGLYAVTAYSVTQRTQEIGIRMALGAQSVQVSWAILRRGLVQLAIGVAIGLAGAYGVGKLLQGLLVQTKPADPATLVTITALLVGMSIVACLLPARGATRLDPVAALRAE
ncbi:MAG: FtsX-like permease family protein [Acidobacteria bacterium]|nr:FtsX-like permease family protein [Acidobacteriota bacterium]